MKAIMPEKKAQFYLEGTDKIMSNFRVSFLFVCLLAFVAAVVYLGVLDFVGLGGSLVWF